MGDGGRQDPNDKAREEFFSEAQELIDGLGSDLLAIDEAIKRVAEQEGPVEEGRKNDYYDRFVPTVYMVMMRFANNDGDALDFADLKQAQLVGEAMTEAVKLCGGKQEPF